MRLSHSAIPKPDPVHVPTPRTPASAYAYCDDCGADAGSPCVDENLRPCSLCPGRVLASTGAEKRAAQERAKRPPPKTQRESRAKPGKRGVCLCCGDVVRLTARYCYTKKCQSEKKRAWRATHPPEDRRGRNRPPRSTMSECPGCHAPQSHSRHCSDLCAHISGMYLRDARRRLTPPANTPE